MVGTQSQVHEPSPNSTIVVIEERTLFRDCLTQSLTMKTECDVVGAASVEACAALCKSVSVKLFVLCITDTAKASEKYARLTALGAHAPIVVVSMAEEIEVIVGAIESGVKGYIPMSMTLDSAVAAIKFVNGGGVFVPAGSLVNAARDRYGDTPMAKHPANVLFTARQAAIVEALRRGKANKLIAHELNMCESTVKVHVRKIMRKLKATNRTQVAFLTNEIFNGGTGDGMIR